VQWCITMGFLDSLKDKVKDGMNEAADKVKEGMSEVAEERKKRKGTFDGLYIYGHPHVKENSIPVWLVLYENCLSVKRKFASGDNLVFELPYEKMESASITDAERLDRSSLLSAAIDGLKKQKVKGEILQITVFGKDKNNNVLRIPILFGDIKRCVQLKTALDNEIGRSQEITI